MTTSDAAKGAFAPKHAEQVLILNIYVRIHTHIHI